MISNIFYRAVLVATILPFASAQKKSKIVPQDLQGGFQEDVQVSYTNEAVNGFSDGTKFDKDAVKNTPTFALGDSNGISPSTLYTIIMVDTTCTNNRVLHYARSNFKNNFDITNIDSKTPPQVEYKAPGSLGESGDNRQYSFLMYLNPQRKQIDKMKLPADGQKFDVKQFQKDNGFTDPDAGVGMVVKLGGQANCGKDQPNSVPDKLPTPIAPSISTSTRPALNAGGPTSTGFVLFTGGGVPSPSAGGQTAAGPQSSKSTKGNARSSGNQAGNNSPTTTFNLDQAESTAAPSDDTPSGRRTDGKDASQTVAGSALPAEQTTNAAPRITRIEVGMASLFMFLVRALIV